MKKLIFIFTFILINYNANSQTINVSLSVPTTPFQDADVGSMAFADIDNDNDQDLLIIGKGGPVKTTLYLNDGFGNFNEATGTPFVNVYSGTVGFGHVNNDNFIDLYITGTTGGGTRTSNLYINNGNGTFSITTSPFPNSNGGSFAFEDIDNDNDKDVIITGITGSVSGVGFTKLYTNNGSGIFSEVLSTPFDQLSNSSVVFIDVENDGDKDIILAGKDSNNINLTKMYLNNGSGVFTVSFLSSFVGISGGDLAVADSDNDGDMDVIVNGSSSQGSQGWITKLYNNNGSGIFTEVTTTPFIGTISGAVEFADFDNDGDKDVIVLGARIGNPSAMCKIYQNQGNNSFVESNDLIATYIASLAIADIDNDTDLDFIIGGTHFTPPTSNPKLYINNLNSPLGALDFYNRFDVSYFPNPTKDFVNLKTVNSIEKITVFNILGEVVWSKVVNEQSYKMDISKLSASTYYIKLENKGQTQTIKLLKL
jgi:hypothetical protein